MKKKFFIVSTTAEFFEESVYIAPISMVLLAVSPFSKDIWYIGSSVYYSSSNSLKLDCTHLKELAIREELDRAYGVDGYTFEIATFVTL